MCGGQSRVFAEDMRSLHPCIPYDVSLNLAKVMEFQPILEAFCSCQHFTMASSSRPVLSLGPLFSDCLSVLPPWLD